MPANRPKSPRPASTSRFMLAAIAIILLLSVSTVMATDIYIKEINEYDIRSNHTYIDANSYTLNNGYFNTITVKKIEDVGTPSAIIHWVDPDLHNTFIRDDTTIFSGSTSVTLTYNDVTVGTGDIGYQYDPDGQNTYVWLVIDDWNDEAFTGMTGALQIQLNYNKSNVNNIHYSTSGKYTNKPAEYPNVALGDRTSGRDFRAYRGYQTYNEAVEFRHEIRSTPIDDIDHLAVLRTVDDKSYTSRVIIIGEGKTAPFSDTTGIEDISLSLPQSYRPYNVNIWSPVMGQWYNTTVYDLDPGTIPDNAPVTVYIKNSQTGALLADAHIEIQDTTTDPWTEVVNQTLPSGHGTFSLAKDPGLHLTQYRIGATVPGYQQVVPAHFFRVTGPTNVVVEMEPLEGGPVNEDNTFLEFYVRDLNANSISNAQVFVDGQLRWTNTAGYTQFEVAKNASYPYSVSKSGYVTIEGTATVADGPRYVVNVVLGPKEIPTNPPATDPGGPGATPTPDRRTNEEKGQAVIDMIADNAEGIGALALICLLMGLLKLMAKW